MRPDRPSLQPAVTEAVSTVAFLVARLADAATSMCALLWRTLRRLARRTHSQWERGRDWASDLLAGPVKQFVTGPLRVALLGRRTDLSLLAVLSAPVLALGVSWWVGSTVGYETLVAWVRGTWFGTDPSLAVFAAAAALVLLAAVTAAANSGLLPTALLVSAPIFGAAATRYGTTVTYTWGAEVVSLPNAVGTAVLLGVGFGLPIAVVGFLLGASVRRAGSTVRTKRAGDTTAKNA